MVPHSPALQLLSFIAEITNPWVHSRFAESESCRGYDSEICIVIMFQNPSFFFSMETTLLSSVMAGKT